MPDLDPRTGLCAACAHSRVITNRQGSRFWYCRLSETDPTFAKYPMLPVLECSGYRLREADDA